jgi:DNA polymerase
MTSFENTRDEKLERLARGIAHCQRCRLHLTRTHAVPGEGSSMASVMLIGEAPGEQEDRFKRPFIGTTRPFFDTLLRDFKLSREDLFITSSVKCRPPDNRNPKADELITCRQNWLLKQMAVIDPSVLVLLGAIAVRCLYGSCGKLKDLHGSIQEYRGRTALITYHPTAGMRFPWIRKAMYEDFVRLRDVLVGTKD